MIRTAHPPVPEGERITPELCSPSHSPAFKKKSLPISFLLGREIGAQAFLGLLPVGSWNLFDMFTQSLFPDIGWLEESCISVKTAISPLGPPPSLGQGCSSQGHSLPLASLLCFLPRAELSQSWGRWCGSKG